MAVITSRDAKIALNGLDVLTPDEIATKIGPLIGLGKAECRSPQRCAIALYMAKVLDVQDPWIVSVGTETFSVYDTVGPDTVIVDLPDSVVTFIQKFDEGHYPELAKPESLPKPVKLTTA